VGGDEERKVVDGGVGVEVDGSGWKGDAIKECFDCFGCAQHRFAQHRVEQSMV